MAGSQLKQLKATLKAHGLTGQTNVKSKGKKAKTPSETRRDDQAKVIANIREQFNPFEIKVNRNKRDAPQKFAKAAVGRPGISKQIGEDERRRAYEMKKSKHNKVGGVVDRRFGENNPNMNPEEKMLARFTRERQVQSSKTSLFNLDDDSDNEMLTHYGKSLSLKDDFDTGDLGLDDDESGFNKKRSFGSDDEEENGVPRKKTKAEVMKEVIAKSKFYKQQRQVQKQKNEEQVMDLDDEFDDVMSELTSIPQPARQKKSEEDKKYDTEVKQVAFDRRAAPSERTKTDEELAKEREEKAKELEQARLRRMAGMDNEDRSAEADDLDDYWAGSDDEETGIVINEGEEAVSHDSDEEDGSESEEPEKEDGKPTFGRSLIKSAGNTSCPQDHDEFLEALKAIEISKHADHVSKIIKANDPRLAQGNKDKIANFTGILLDHILYLADSEYDNGNTEEFAKAQEGFFKHLKELAQKYNEPLVEAFRAKIEDVQERILETQTEGKDTYPMKSDLVFFSLIGRLYSTSDHYHLVVTPAIILMAESIEQTKVDSLKNIFSGCFMVDMFLQYQRISKRYIPEVTAFLERALIALAPESSKLDFSELYTASEYKETKLSLSKKDKLINKNESLKLSQLNNLDKMTLASKSALLLKVISLIDKSVSIWKEKTAFIEISSSFVYLLKHLVKYYAANKEVPDLLQKLIKLNTFAAKEHKPLALQSHKPLAIATYAPKFEDNFNPDKKSYDPNRDRQEVSKLKAQIKNERKITIRELRKDTKFEAREQIKEKKEAYKDYHRKMASIVNSISTIEGAEKNEYEREKKQRKNQR